MEQCVASARRGEPQAHASVLRMLVPKVGLEPTRPLGATDFESAASANSATSARLLLSGF